MTPTQTGHRLEIRRKFSVPRERLYAAWTETDQMMKWGGPEGMHIVSYDAETRVGGAYRLVMERDDNKEQYIAKGVFHEIRPPEFLKYSWCWEEDTPEEEHDTMLTIEFIDLGKESELVLIHENLKSEESVQGHTHGWGEMLDKMGKFLHS